MNWLNQNSTPTTKKAFFFGLLLALACCMHELPAPKIDPVTGNLQDTTVTQIPLDTGNCDHTHTYFANDVRPLIQSLCARCHQHANETNYKSILSFLGSTKGDTTNLIKQINKMKAQRNNQFTAPTSAQMATLKAWILEKSPNDSCQAGCDTTKFAYAANIAPIFAKYCVGCHTGASAQLGVDLSSYTGVQSEITKVPGELQGAIEQLPGGHFYNSATSMPPGSKLAACQIAQIRQWIKSGYPNN